MTRVYTNELKDHIDETVTVAGWVDTIRNHGKLTFIDIRDMTGVVQTVATAHHPDAQEKAHSIHPEWVIEVRGKVNKRPENMVNSELPTGDIELALEEITVLSEATELPFDKGSDINLDTYLDYLPLTLRREAPRAIFKVQAHILAAFREFLEKERFTEIQSPKLIREDAEGGASVFDVSYFKTTAHLAQSPQFYKQIMVGVFERVFTIGKVFRAEKHATTRHINEYTSLDFEFGFIKDHTDVIALSCRLMNYIVNALKETCSAEFALLNAEFPKTPQEFPILKLREAQEILKKEYGKEDTDEPDLTPEHERLICDYAARKYNSDFIFITHFPTEKRPMYTYEDASDPGYTKGFDLLFRGLEIQTGGQRIHNKEVLIKNMKKKGLDPDDFSYYLQAFAFGMPPHGGLGMGLERLTARFLGIENVKQATLFPRDINRIDTRLPGAQEG